METKAIKKHATQVGLVTGGLMSAHLISSVIPVQNDKIKAAIPLALGATATLTSKNPMVQTLGAGIAAYGTIKMVRALFMGSDPSGTNGIQGIADNPNVRKILDMLVPNLGSLEEGSMNFEYGNQDYFEPAIVDVPFEEVDEDDEFEEVEGFEQMNGINNTFEESSLLGFDEQNLLGIEYDNELYL